MKYRSTVLIYKYMLNKSNNTYILLTYNCAFILQKRKMVGESTSTQVLRDLEISLRTNHIE